MKNIHCLLLPVVVLFFSAACSKDPLGTDDNDPRPKPRPDGIVLTGWQLDATNTGIAVSGLQESDLTPFDLNGADAGKGEWIGGEGAYLYLYGNKIIENRIITFTSYMRAIEGKTIIRNCIIRPTNCQEGMSLISLDGATLENCIIDGSLLGISNIAHTGVSATNSTIRGCMIHDVDCGFMLYNTTGITYAINNYVYNILYQPGSDDHLAGCSIWEVRGYGISVIGNKIVIDDPSTLGVTSAGLFLQSLRGPINNILIEDNLIISPAYVTRLTDGGYPTTSPITFNNNRFFNVPSASYSWGYYTQPTSISYIPRWTNNYIYDPSATDAKGSLITIN